MFSIKKSLLLASTMIFSTAPLLAMEESFYTDTPEGQAITRTLVIEQRVENAKRAQALAAREQEIKALQRQQEEEKQHQAAKDKAYLEEKKQREEKKEREKQARQAYEEKMARSLAEESAREEQSLAEQKRALQLQREHAELQREEFEKQNLQKATKAQMEKDEAAAKMRSISLVEKAEQEILNRSRQLLEKSRSLPVDPAEAYLQELRAQWAAEKEALAKSQGPK